MRIEWRIYLPLALELQELEKQRKDESIVGMVGNMCRLFWYEIIPCVGEGVVRLGREASPLMWERRHCHIGLVNLKKINKTEVIYIYIYVCVYVYDIVQRVCASTQYRRDGR